MNSSRRFFIKMGISLAALLFIGGCGPEQTQAVSKNASTQPQMSVDLEVVEHDNFKIEYDRENLIVKIILKSNENVTLVSKPNGDGTRTLTTLDGESVLVLAAGQHGFTTTTRIVLTEDSNGYPLIKIFPAK